MSLGPPSFAFRSTLDIDKWCYHYTSRSTALEKILPERTLRLNPFSDVNDPRESKELEFFVSSDLGIDPANVSRALRRRCKLLCMTRDHPALSDGNMSEQDRGYGHARMWAQTRKGVRNRFGE